MAHRRGGAPPIRHRLRAALGDRYEGVLAQSRTIDLDRAIDELVEADPAAQALGTASAS